MKVGTFIKIVSDTFASQIMPSESTGRTSNQLKYQTVITWFISYGAEEQELVNKAMMKSSNFCNKVMNETLDDDMPINDAAYLKGRISAEGFEEIYDNANLDDVAIDAFIKRMAEGGITITAFNFVNDVTNALFALLESRSNVNRKGSIRKAEFISDTQVRIGTRIIKLPDSLAVPNLPSAKENGYVEALLQVYAQDAKKDIKSLHDLDSMPIVYKSNLQLCREDFYDAESVLHKVRDLFTDSEKEFNNVKEEVYKGIKYQLNIPKKNGFDRLNSTMEYVITISLRKSFLSSSNNGLVGPSEERGMVHMLVNEGKIQWIREDIDHEGI